MKDFSVLGTANVQGSASTLTLFTSDAKGNQLYALQHNNVPMTTTIYGCINSVCQFDFKARGKGLPSKAEYVIVKSESGAVAGPYKVA